MVSEANTQGTTAEVGDPGDQGAEMSSTLTEAARLPVELAAIGCTGERAAPDNASEQQIYPGERLVVTHHPWILIRTNLVDLPAPEQLHLGAVKDLHAAREAVLVCAEVFIAGLMRLGRNEQPEVIRKAARKLARCVRRAGVITSGLDHQHVAAATQTVTTLLTALPDDLSGPAASWVESLATLADATTKLEGSLATQLEAERKYISRILDHPALRLAAPMSSCSMAEAAAKYVDHHRTPTQSSRKSEPRLVRLAMRAQHRVSPFSYYTAVGLGWESSDPGAAHVATTDYLHLSQITPRVSADLASLARLVRRRLDALDRHTPLVSSPTLPPDLERAGAGVVRVCVAVDDATELSRVLDSSTRTTTIRRTPVIAAIMGLAITRVTPDQIVARLGITEHPRVEQLHAVIVEMRRLGLLAVWDPVPSHTADPVTAAADKLAELAPNSTTYDEIISDLRAIALEIEGVRLSTGVDRRPTLVALGDAWATAGTRVARPVYEDVTFDEPVAVETEVFRQIRSDLSQLARLADVFDNTHIGHALLHRGLRQRLGARRSIPFTEFSEILPEILAASSFDRDAMIKDVREHDPDVALLIAARDVAAQQLRRAGIEGAEEVRWTTKQVDALVCGVPASLRRPRSSLAWFLQPTRVEGHRVTGAVINAVHDGDAQMFSRFLGGWGEETLTAVRARLVNQLGPDSVEVDSVHGFNANVHPWLLEQVFDTGNTVATDDPRTFINPTNLVVHLGEHTVYATDSTGRQLHPNYFGFLVPFLLPPVEAALYMLGRGPLVRMDLAPDIERLSGPDEIIAYPRVTFGSIVVTRRAWSMPVSLFPTTTSAESTAAYLLRMDLFRERHGIGQHVFIRSEPKVESTWQQFVAMRTKPLPVDLRSPLHLRLLPTWLGDAARVRVTESLPDFYDRRLDVLGAGSCTEYILETVCGTRTRVDNQERQ